MARHVNNVYDLADDTRLFMDLKDFTEIDMRENAQETDADAIVGIPPFVAGSLDNRSLASGAEYEWAKPEFPNAHVHDIGHFESMMDHMMDINRPWCLISGRKVTGYPVLGVYFAKHAEYYLYGEPEYEGIRCRGDERNYLFPLRVTPETFSCESEVGIHPVGLGVYNTLYDYYMGEFHTGSFDVGFLVLVDGRMAGGFGFSYAEDSGLCCTSYFDIYLKGGIVGKLIHRLMQSEEVRKEILYRTFVHYPRVLLIGPANSRRYDDTGFESSIRDTNNILMPGQDTYEAPWSGITMSQTYDEWFFNL